MFVQFAAHRLRCRMWWRSMPAQLRLESDRRDPAGELGGGALDGASEDDRLIGGGRPARGHGAGGTPLLHGAGTDGPNVVARVMRQAGARDGDRVQLPVDTGALHFFDPTTGDRI